MSMSKECWNIDGTPGEAPLSSEHPAPEPGWTPTSKRIINSARLLRYGARGELRTMC